jgi:hypothetical protein
LISCGIGPKPTSESRAIRWAPITFFGVPKTLGEQLPRGIGVERLRDPLTEWSRQFEALGLNPE